MRKKKSIALLLVAILLIGTFSPAAFALESSNTYKIGIVNSLKSLEETSLGDIGFENLLIGDPIPTYIYENDGSFTESNIYYPLFKGEKLVLLVIPHDGWYQITTEMVPELDGAVSTSASFALIYDRYGCNLYTSGSLVQSVRNSEPFADRSILRADQSISRQAVKTSSFEVKSNLGYETFSQASSAQRSNYIGCVVNRVLQAPYDKLCWAAAVACIANYVRGTSHTAASISQMYFEYIGGAPSTVVNARIDLGEELVPLRLVNLIYSYRVDTPSLTAIRNNLQAGYPLFTAWMVQGATKTHSAVVCGTGMNGNSPYMYVMDPEFGFTNAQQSGSYTISYISTYSGSTLWWYTTSCLYWS